MGGNEKLLDIIKQHTKKKQGSGFLETRKCRSGVKRVKSSREHAVDEVVKSPRLFKGSKRKEM